MVATVWAPHPRASPSTRETVHSRLRTPQAAVGLQPPPTAGRRENVGLDPQTAHRAVETMKKIKILTP